MPQPLTGLKVLDFTTLLPGPLATLLLAEAGAEVIKIERPEGEDMRAFFEPRWNGVSAAYAMLNAGKRSVTLDLKQEAGLDAAQKLIADADVLVEQFRPGVMARLGLGWEQVRAINPRLVYCSISGYGQTGPLAGRAGHDLNYIGETGILALNPGPAEAPQVPPLLAADIAGGSYPAVINILLALKDRERSGEGAYLDVAMADNMFPFAFWALPMGWLGDAWPDPATHALAGGSPRYRLYPTRDGRLLAVAALEERFWLRFCDAIALPDPLRAPDAQPRDVIAGVAKIVAAESASHWREIFARADCCCSIVNSLAEAHESTHFRQRGLFDYRVAWAGAELGALPLPIAPAFRAPPEVARTLPELGEDNDTVS